MNREAAIPVEEAIEELGPKRRFPSYPEYRDSGVEWLGPTPRSWGLKRLKHVTKCLDGKRVPLNAEQRGGMQGDYPYWGANGVLDCVDNWLFDEPLVLLGEDGAPFFEPHKDVAFSVNAKIWVNNHAHVLRPTGIVPTFLAHYLNTVNYSAYIEGTTRDKLVQGKMKEIPVASPPLDEQRAIAAFLDRETARIDELIAKKKRLIELLAEKRTALISHAVTKGLNPDASMKDTDIEWLGQVPEHWDVLPLRRRWQVIDCKHRTVPFLDEGIPLASIGEVQGVELDLNNAKRTSEEEYRLLVENDRQPQRGDIIYSRNATVGAAAFVNTDETFCMGQDVCMIRSRQQDQRYLVYQLRSPSIMSQLDQVMIGATFKRVNVADIKALTVACPPIVEQQAIGAYCRERSAQFQALRDTVQSGLCRLREYRSALISAAVTGKIDVREKSK